MKIILINTLQLEVVSRKNTTAKVVNSYCLDNVGVFEGEYKKGKILLSIRQIKIIIFPDLHQYF